MLEFLIPFLAAIESKSKYDKQRNAKANMQDVELLKREVEEIQREINSNYTDICAEKEILPLSKKKLEKIAESMPSYNRDKPWKITGDSPRYNTLDVDAFCSRLALADFGFLPHKESGFHCKITINTDTSYEYGSEEHEYLGQLKHELMLEWEKRLRENGFPYKLMVSNWRDNPRGISSVIKQFAREAAKSSYRNGNIYYWNYRN